MSTVPVLRVASAVCAALLLSFGASPTFADADETGLYWTEYGAVNSATVDGEDSRTLVYRAFGISGSLAVDGAAGKLYWNSVDLGQIMRSNVDGTEIEIVVCEDLELPVGLSIDPVDQKLYWIEPGFGNVKRSNLDGSDVETVATFLGLDALTTAIDEVGRGLFWIRGTTLQRFDLVDGTLEDVIDLSPQIALPVTRRALSVDPVRRKVYWGLGYFSSTWGIQRANLDGTDVETVTLTIGGSFGDHPFVVDPAAERLYWIDGGQLIGAELDGANPEVVTESFSANGLAVDRVTGRVFSSNGNVYIRSVDPARPSEVSLDVALPYGPSVLAIDDAARRVYWSDGFGIYRATTTGADREHVIVVDYNDPSSIFPSDWFIPGMDIDPTTDALYYQAEGELRRSTLDGTDSVVLIRDAPGSRLRVDRVGQKLYWTDGVTGRILRANVDGTQIEEFVPAASTDPVQMQFVDGSGGWVYYSVDDTIYRTPVNGVAITPLFKATGLLNLVVDENDRLYWSYRTAVPGDSGIRSANVDGSDIQGIGDFEGALALALARRAVTGDVDGDGTVGSVDLTGIIGNWGPCACSEACPTDLNLDDGTGMADLTIVLRAWGSTR